MDDYYDDDDDDEEEEEEEEEEQQQQQEEALCCICATADESRRLCFFRPTVDDPSCVVIHLFCGKTAGILPHINRPDLELLTKANLKNKYGSGVSVSAALQKVRTCCVVDGPRKTTEYYIVGEFERIYNRLTKEEQQHQKQHQQQQQLTLQSLLVDDEQDALFFDTTSNIDADLSDPFHHPAMTTSATSATLMPTKNKYANVSPEPTVSDLTTTTSTTLSSPTYYDEDDYYQQQHQQPPPPPNKKLKTAPPSPYQVSMDRLQHVCERELGIGYNVVRGVARASQAGDHEVDDDHFDPNLCSLNQVQHIRIIITTQRRELQKQHMESLLASKTHQAAYLDFQNLYHEETLTWPERMDMLLGFTEKLKDLDPWMGDAEWKGQDILASLAMLWKDALQYRPSDLGLDPEFSYPGVLALLENLQGILEEAGADPPLLFPYSNDDQHDDEYPDHEHDEYDDDDDHLQ